MFEFTFMQHAFIAGGIIALICGIMSVFVVTRRCAFAAHALSHISLTGASGAMLIGLSAMTGQLVITIIAGFFMALVGDKIWKNDVAIGIVLTFFLGLGAYFLFLYQSGYSGSVMSIFFGNILSVSTNQIFVLIGLTCVILIGLSIMARPLFISGLDPIFAAAKRIPQYRLNIAFFILLAITVSMACQVVGILLVFALLVGPGAIALQWANGFYKTILLSLMVALIIVWFSIGLSFYINQLPTSVSITTLMSLIYGFGLLKQYITRG